MCALNIYLVEDNPLIALSLKRMIAGMGHRICGSASNYEKAVADLQTLKPDLVITDIMLESNRTGIDLGRYINRYLHIPFIYQSSVDDDELIFKAHATQPEAYLVKPVIKKHLEEVLEPCLAG
ncbi:response regulator [Mucilaginibacter mali]|uniref:Response regulator n=1 Tax=Mucilaginibacter mali TaxID=2740462 RepID=A0A7D4QAM7_9SPHI|nr:response regulator [Mucilaginibacter mali]QKJ32071.1 response regulator [Mucilaginibacter mali]